MIARGYESYVAIPLRSDGRRITPIGYGGVPMMVRATTTARPADTVALAVSARQTGTVHTQTRNPSALVDWLTQVLPFSRQ